MSRARCAGERSGQLSLEENNHFLLAAPQLAAPMFGGLHPGDLSRSAHNMRVASYVRANRPTVKDRASSVNERSLVAE